MSTGFPPILLILLFILFLSYFVFIQPVDYTPLSSRQRLAQFVKNAVNRAEIKNVSEIKNGGKWIVVTSISSPTDDVKRLASFQDWNLVVVADTKTPNDWHLEGVHYLSTELQEASDFSIVSKLPYKSYTRKNIGYLYAISNGAEWIYDTDDDNKPYNLGLDQFQYNTEISGVVYYTKSTNISQRIFNPYRFFGLEKMWPRGFPLEHIKTHTNGNDRLALCYRIPRPSVQQGLVHHDPDVDAIYRLINADPATGLDERFNKFAPPITLSPGTYSAWNSQNTLFHKSAFHTMFLPTTVSFRTTDIWRSYFAQKILHLSGLTVGFTPVNAVQFRNAHDYLKDLIDEHQVYKDAGKIVKLIDEWTCNSTTVLQCMLDLADTFVEFEIWKQGDADLIALWIDDLKMMGFEFPPLNLDNSIYEVSNNESSRDVICRRMNIEFSLDNPENRNEAAEKRAAQKIEFWGDIDDWCKEVKYHSFTNSLPSPKQLARQHSNHSILNTHLNNVLIVVNNFEWKFSIGLIQRIYSPYFATTIFCGSYYPTNYSMTDSGFPRVVSPLNYVHMNPAEMHRGYFGYHCLTLVKEMMLANVGGYVMMADDATFNIWQKFDFNRVFHLTGVAYLNEDNWWTGEFGLAAARRIVKFINETRDEETLKVWKQYEDGLRKYGYINQTMTAFDDLLQGKSRSISDFYYVPTGQSDYYAKLMRIFYEQQLFLELAVNRFLRSVRHQTSRELTESYLWGSRGKWPEFYNASLVAIHPIKFSGFAKSENHRKTFCRTVLQTMHNVLINNSHDYTMKNDTDIDHLNG
ncbi:unnamed protein product [Caenorhabditis bovis]|uniref:Uncharacterized protein n=1 Tax=Caenorhabditis bovis TaxID=2654633 RepID=A0A8S1ESE4_9PELO|nr:unnamed protein product [Caenorhabditis bovis]